jgi:ubiquitin-conjugating enzyme E2 S
LINITKYNELFQTIKCLLIVPNPESALNEEAGKMLLEHYEDYCNRAKMMTEIHAQPSKVKEYFEADSLNACCSKSKSVDGRNPSDVECEPSVKKLATEKNVSKSINSSTALSHKNMSIKDKKRALKRL